MVVIYHSRIDRENQAVQGEPDYESYPEAAVSRPGLRQAMDQLREGDVLVVWRLDRLGRSLRNLLDLVAQLEEKKVGFRSLQESMDTSSSGGRLIFHVFGALAEFERNLIKDRTNAGLAAARARGKTGGRQRKLDENQRSLAVRLYNEGKPVNENCQTMNVSKPTLYRYVRNGA